MHVLILACLLSADIPVPRFVPTPQFVPLPKFTVPVEAEVAEPAPVWGIVAWRPGPCPTCPATPEYGWIQPELTPDQAARRLQKWRELPKDVVKKLEAIVNAPAVRKALRQEYSVGTCGMALGCHGSILYDVFDDGTKEPAAEQPAGYSSGGRWRLFGRRR